MQRQILINVMIFFAYALNLPLNTQRPHHRSQRAGKLGLDFGSWQSPDISRSHLYRGTFPWTPPTAIYRAYTVSWLLMSIISNGIELGWTKFSDFSTKRVENGITTELINLFTISGFLWSCGIDTLWFTSLQYVGANVGHNSDRWRTSTTSPHAWQGNVPVSLSVF